ncbi:MAG: hypothetical protein WCI73_07275 [Phycisphaerae bacterium]
MLDPSEVLHSRASAYANARGVVLEATLGSGKDGFVFSTNERTAIKIFHQAETFHRERACYLRFQEVGTYEILGHHVPRFLKADAVLLALEMSIVQPPYILDFASGYLDDPPDFPEEVITQWQQAKTEEFGSHWSRVQVILEVLKQNFGIYLLDVHPGNIAF